ncbi:T9SS type A sorting domain-containing protein [Hymenobacter ruricola]|uniref:T9SS type A sorting domain-containing protein n=1 Tax=Hymenobacter ruricola TaxID=2791023 RepID=A0ABS0I4S0_9BACT|nr:T9SS type A sorting domain-containing protein [Hymenobacter ruricola]MBF9221940.1 T9SS type A sorting domain-containing protein [Hymenobacter ruricola]
MMQAFTLLRALVVGKLVLFCGAVALVGMTGEAHAQCTTCNITITAANAGNNFSPSNGTICIGAGVNFTGTINVAGDNVTICNSGTMNGTVKVPNNTANTIIYNGTAAGSGAVWNSYVGNNFKDPVVINNYGTWNGSIQPLAAGSTVNNKAGTTWAVYTTYAGNVTVVNDGTWSGSLQPSNGVASAMSITNTGTWSGYIEPKGTIILNNSGTWNATSVNYTGSLTVNHTAGAWSTGLTPSGSSSIAVSNSANWTQGFNFPSPGPSQFTNAAGATATFGSYLGIAASTTLVNNGTMNLNGGMAAITSNSSLTNSSGSTFSVTGGIVNNGTITNASTISASGNFNNNAGGSLTNSSGSAFSVGGETVNSGTIANAGTLAVSANFTNSASGVVTGPAAPQRGTITAGGYTQNSGAFGVTGRLNFCDAGSPSNGFDAAGGTIGSATIFCSAAPLPVVLTYFSAQASKGTVQLRWATATEHNSKAFVIERSADGEVFAAVAETKAQGSSTRAMEYAAVDAKPLPGTSYYRLRQVDVDGTTTYSKAATVSVAVPNQPVDFYPNPAADRLTLDLSTAPATPCEVRLVRLTGQLWLRASLTGGRAQELPLAGVPAGLYLLHVRTAQGSTVQRLEKQ